LKWHIFSGKPSEEAAEGVVFGVEDAGDILPDADCRMFTSFVSLVVNGIGQLHI
jgi:hypothetical protein